MEIEEDNLLISYNPVEAISNNVAIEAIYEGPNYPEYKDIQFENIKKLG